MIRKARVGVGLVAFVAAGCLNPTPTPVSVNLDAIASRMPDPTPRAPDSATPPASFSPLTIESPRLERRVMRAAGRNLNEVRALVEQQRERTRLALERQLRRFYEREGRRFELNEKRELSARDRAQFERVNQEIRTIFEGYAEKRLHPLVDLTVIVGFPDPNPQSQRPERPLGAVSEKRFQRATSLRETIRDLDAEFHAEVEAMLKALGESMALDRAETLVRIELFKDELNRRAEELARQQIAAAESELRLELSDPERIDLPEIPAQRYRTRPGASLPASPTVAVDPSLLSPAARRARLEGKLRIWMGLNRYTLASGGRDATAEFEQWMRQTAPGP